MPFAFLDRIDSRLATRPSSQLLSWMAFASFLLLPWGLGLSVMAFREAVDLARDVPAQCVVESARVVANPPGVFLSRRRTASFNPVWDIALTDGSTRLTAALRGPSHRHRAKAASALGAHVVGERIPCWYDAERNSGLRPSEPQLWRVVVGGLLGVLLLGGWAYVGAWALHNRGKSEPELLARDVKRRSQSAPEPDAAVQVEELPAWTQQLPLPEITTSAGSVLRRRLEADVVPVGNPAWAWVILVGAGTLALALVTLANDAGWLWTFVVPLALATGALGVHAVRRGQEGTLRAPRVEVGRFALQPGERTEMYLEQVGPLEVEDLAVTLELRERVTQREADGLRGTRVADVRSVTLLAQDAQRLARGELWQRRLTLEIPADAMCSFQSTHHALEWAVVISATGKEGALAPVRYPLLVLPAVTE